MGRWILVFVLALAMAIICARADDDTDYTQLQAVIFRNNTNGSVGVLTTSNGAPVEYHETSTLNDDLIDNPFFLDIFTHLTSERIPERFNHAKGAGAFGYFEVTQNISHVCKAKFLDTVGKKTPISVRFSTTVGEKGSADTIRGSKGFAAKFYTEEGNFDLVCFNTEMFFLKDPLLFHALLHAEKRNPVTNVLDANTFWDLITQRPEFLSIFILLFGDRGVSDGYRHMPAYPIHTYEVKNEDDESHFVRFHIRPDAGIKSLNSSEATRLAGTDADYATRDLYNAIARGDYPTWTVSVQILTVNDVKNATHDPFDITRTISLDDFPLHEVGKITLNRNPVNYHAEVEQLALCPANLVPGILGSPDKVFQARRLAYKLTQTHRLGSNFNKIPINCPISQAFTLNRDGYAPVNDNERGMPNYYPNSFNGAAPYMGKNAPRPMKIKQTDTVDNLDQAAALWQSYSDDEKERTVAAIVANLGRAVMELQQKAADLFASVDSNLGNRLYIGLGLNSTRTKT